MIPKVSQYIQDHAIQLAVTASGTAFSAWLTWVTEHVNPIIQTLVLLVSLYVVVTAAIIKHREKKRKEKYDQDLEQQHEEAKDNIDELEKKLRDDR